MKVEYVKIDIPYIVSEIDNMLSSKCYVGALTAMLSLVDVCAGIEFGNDKRDERIIDWWSCHIEPRRGKNDTDSIISGGVIVNLRNKVLHNQLYTVDKLDDKGRRSIGCQYDEFTLVFDEFYDPKFNLGGYLTSTDDFFGKTMTVSVCELWFYIKETVLNLYNTDKCKYDYQFTKNFVICLKE